MATASDGQVILEDFEEDKAEQLWKKGKPDAEGYFTLENYGVSMVITAISESGLEIKFKSNNSEMDITTLLIIC